MNLQTAAILAGLATTHNVGEHRQALDVAADARLGVVQAEGWFTTADKIETGDGWASRLGVDTWSGPLSVGASWAHRQTGHWTKDVLFVRVGAAHDGLRILAEVAPTSPNMEARLETRLRLHHGSVLVEPRAWVGWHITTKELGGYAYGLSLLIGLSVKARGDQ